ncbi:MAG: hypothetical protein L6U99_07800 [Clostridium sp.]|nr:MAG: hypothetical protein L6U99_07800 [Clostridium sp.]
MVAILERIKKELFLLFASIKPEQSVNISLPIFVGISNLQTLALASENVNKILIGTE